MLPFPRRVFAASLLSWLLVATDLAIGQWQLTDGPGRKLDTDQPVVLTSGGYALIGINNSTVGVYDVASGRLIRNIGLPNGAPIETRTFAADNGRLLMTDSIFAPNRIRGHSRAYSFDIATGRQLAEMDLQSPTRRVALGQTLATDGELGILSSVKCIAECDTDPILRGVVDVFDLETGAHVYGIVHEDQSNFGAALDIDQDVVAVSSASHEQEERVAASVHLFDARSGEQLNTIVPDGDPHSRRGFGTDLVIENGRLVVGDKEFFASSDQFGSVSVFDIASGDSIAEYTMDQLELAGIGQFGHALDVSGNYFIAGAPESRSTALNAMSESHVAANSAEGAVVIANFTAGPEAIFRLETWVGGDSVAIAGEYALVRSTANDQTSIYSISLVGLLPSIAAVSPAKLQTFGDLDGDGNVAFADFLVFSDNYGANVEGVGHGDLNSNGIVDFADFLILSENYDGAVARSQPVPEPSMSSLVLGLAGGLISRRKRRCA